MCPQLNAILNDLINTPIAMNRPNDQLLQWAERDTLDPPCRLRALLETAFELFYIFTACSYEF